MSDDVASINDASAALENAIQEGEPRLWSVFLKYRDVYVHSTGASDLDPSDEDVIVRRYLTIFSLYAACFQLKGDKANRDKVAQSCTLFMTSVRRDPIGMLE